MSEDTPAKLDNLSKKCSNCPPWTFTQACSVGIENKISFVEIKPVPVVKHVEIRQFNFTKVVQKHTLGAVGSTYLIFLEIYSGVTVPKIIEIAQRSTKGIARTKGWFLRHSVDGVATRR